MTALAVQPSQPQPPAGAQEVGQSSPIALVLILALLVVVALLVRSMNKHLRKVPESFDEPAGTDRPETDTDER